MSIFSPDRDLSHLSSLMADRVEKWLKLCKINGLDILVYETLRTLMRQRFLWAFGRFGINRTKAKVTWTMKSNHLTGNAIDFCFLEDNKASYEGDWELAWGLAAKVGLSSLYLKYRTDKPHLEFNKKWSPTIAKAISDNEKILEQRMVRAWAEIDEVNAVKKYLAELKDVEFRPYIIS